MIAVTLGEAKTIGAVVAGVLLLLAIAGAWLMATIAKKAMVAGVLALLALLVWSQRASLTDCAAEVRAAGLRGDTTCSFFGQDVQIRRSGSS